MKRRISICLFLLISTIYIKAQEGILYTLKDGLSNSFINAICQGDDGFIWVATDYGLNRFDGVNFRVFNLTNSRSPIINTNSFKSICFDKNGRLIAGTQNGLYFFDQDRDMLVPISIPEVPELSNSPITYIFVDKKNNIWVSLSGVGLVCIAQNTKDTYTLKIKRFQANLCDISCIFESSDDSIWIGTRSYGAFRLNADFTNVEQYHVAAKGKNSIVGNCVYTIAEDINKNVLIGVFGSGISLINIRTGEQKSIRLNKDDPKSLICHILVDSSNRIVVGSDASGLYLLDIEKMQLIPLVLSVQSVDMKNTKVHVTFEDRFQNLWVGIHQKGVLIIPKESKAYQFIGHDPYTNNFPDNSILSITQDKQNNLWIGTDGGGLVKYNLQDRFSKIFALNTSNLFPDNIILSVYSHEDVLWVGTYLAGAVKIDLKTEKQTQYISDKAKNSILSNYVNAITTDLNGRVWFGTGDYGVCCLDLDGKFKNLYEFTNQRYNIGFVYNLYCDKGNKLWISAKNGVFTVDIQNQILDNLPTLNKTLLNSAVYSTREDGNGIVWLSNINGLIRYNPVTANIEILHPQNSSIGNNIVNAIEIDNFGNIWGSSTTGIFKYQPKSDISNYYPGYIGLPNNEFNEGVSFNDKRSNIFFGGITGISYFSPSESGIKREIQQIYITELKIHNRSIAAYDDEKQGFKKAITKIDTIELSHDQNHFFLQFASIEYAFPERVRYKYILEGSDTEWKETDSKNNTAYYTSIAPGKYVFKVIASFDPLFSNYIEKKLTIIINPPIWWTWWAKILYILITVSLIYVFSWHYIKRIKTKQELLREKHAAELLEAQLVSFTNVSHEIRTPLTIIMGILRRLIKRKEENIDQSYRMMMNNSEKILRLTNQLLDVHMLDVGVLKLKFDYIDIIDYMEEMIENFRPLASESDISMTFVKEMENLDAIIDPEAFNKIMYNLLGNAIKYTGKGTGKQITTSVTWNDDENFKIEVKDTGTGIPEEKLDKIFDRFYKNTDSISIKQGVGIGLHLVKSLVDLMGGSIEVSSKVGEGTSFSVILPIVGSKKEEDPDVISNEMWFDNETESEQKIRVNHQIALVEDNKDILNFISEELEDYYKVITFSTATEAYSYLLENPVDLIVSDVMMPDIDGFEFCGMVKSNPKTQLIPVILLTAKTDYKSQIKGAKEGADAYITKPFMMEILIANINNLINVRKIMSSKYSSQYEFGVIDKIEEYKSPNDRLLERFITIIKDQIGNPELDIEHLSKEMGISRANLYRKLKSITNQTPSIFIRNVRLEQATILLKKNISSSEVAYIVGFNSHSYFSKLFSEKYGCSPSEYAAKNGIS